MLLVLLDRDLEPTAIYEARRPAIKRAIEKPGSSARNERGALSISQFKAIAKRAGRRSSMASGPAHSLPLRGISRMIPVDRWQAVVAVWGALIGPVSALLSVLNFLAQRRRDRRMLRVEAKIAPRLAPLQSWSA